MPVHGATERTTLLRSVFCPHCLHRFGPQDLLWLAEHPELMGDPVLGDDAARRFLPSRFTIDGKALDPKGEACTRLACPRCHLAVPRQLASQPPVIFALAGTKSSAKSHFLAAMGWELGRLLPQRFGLSLAAVESEGNDLVRGYQNRLFDTTGEAQVFIPKTFLGDAEHYQQVMLDGQRVELARPIMYTLKPLLGSKGAIRSWRGRPPLLCFYDVAGEHFGRDKDTATAPGTRHLAHAGVVMFLFDPLQDPRWRRRLQDEGAEDPQLDNDWIADSDKEPQEQALERTADRLRRHANLDPHSPIKRPLLVLVSKADLWARLLPDEDLETEPLVQEPEPALDIARIERVSARIRQLLAEYSPHFLAIVEGLSEHVVYLPVSPLGRSPVRDPKTSMLGVPAGAVQPRWVTVPILYTFARWVPGSPIQARATNEQGITEPV